MPDTPLHRRLLAEPLGEGLVLARDGGDRVFALNATARFLWEALESGADEAALAGLLAGRFALPPDQAARDSEAMLALWRAEGLLPPLGTRRWRLALGDLDIALDCAPGGVADALGDLLAHLASPRGGAVAAALAIAGAEGRYRLTQDGKLLGSSLAGDGVIERLFATLAAVAAARQPWGLALHAGAVGRDGSCLLLPAESRSGKSTLTAALLSQPGQQLLSDDFALIAVEDFTVHPLGLPVVLKAGSWPALDGLLPDLATRPTFQRQGEPVRYWTPPPAQRAPGPLPVRGLVMPRHIPGAPARLQRLEPFDALARVIRAPAQVKAPLDAARLAALTAWFQRTPAWRLTFGEAAEALPLLAAL